MYVLYSWLSFSYPLFSVLQDNKGGGYKPPLFCSYYFRGDNMKENENRTLFTAAASSGDCTGLIPSGGNHTPEEIEEYRDIVPFAMPAKDKGYDRAEMKRIEKQNKV